MGDIDDLRDRLEDVEATLNSPPPIVVVSEASGYPSAAEFERQYGYPPAESDELVIRLPKEVEKY